MTSQRRRKSETMPYSLKEKKNSLHRKEKSDEQSSPKVVLPLLKKSVYIDIKNGKQAEVIEDQLKKLGAIVEKFLSREVNYVISSSAPPTKPEERHSNEDNPQSPSFSVPSPFSSIPSPTAPSETKAAVASTVVTNAEKWGIKVVSVEAASKWLEREIQKIEKEVEKNTKKEIPKKEVKKPKKKVVKRKKKVLKGCYIKFEAMNRMYRPVKSELARWPKLNLLAPPGLNSFCEVKMKVHNFLRRHASMRNIKTSTSSGKGNLKKTNSMSSIKESVSLVTTTLQATPDVVAVPITTTGDVKRHLDFPHRKRPDKSQGYCECCRMKYKDMKKHIKEDEHQSFARDKSNYESLDTLIKRIPSTSQFLQETLLRHCMQKQTETASQNAQNISNSSRHAATKLDIDVQVQPVISPLISEATPDAERIGPSTRSCLQSPTISKELCDFNKIENRFLDHKESGADIIDDARPHAVVIRRRTPSGCFVSPRRREPTPSKRPWMQERSMVFRDSPMASLQPSDVSKGLTYIIGDTTSANLFQKSHGMSSSHNCAQSKPKSIVRSLMHMPDFVSSIDSSADSERLSEKVNEEEILDSKPEQICTDSTFKTELAQEKTSLHKINFHVNETDATSFGNFQLIGNTNSQDCVEGAEHKTHKQSRKLKKSPDVFVPCIADRVKRRSRVCGVAVSLKGQSKFENITQKSENIEDYFGDCTSSCGSKEAGASEDCSTAQNQECEKEHPSPNHNVIDVGEELDENETKNNSSQNAGEHDSKSVNFNSQTLKVNENRCKLMEAKDVNSISLHDKLTFGSAEKSGITSPSKQYKRGQKESMHVDKPVKLKQLDENSSHKFSETNKDVICNESYTNSQGSVSENQINEPTSYFMNIEEFDNVTNHIKETSDLSCAIINQTDEDWDQNLENISKNTHSNVQTAKSAQNSTKNQSFKEKKSTPHKEGCKKSGEFTMKNKRCAKKDKRMKNGPAELEGTSTNIAEGVKSQVRQCRIFVHEGFYAQDAERFDAPSSPELLGKSRSVLKIEFEDNDIDLLNESSNTSEDFENNNSMEVNSKHLPTSEIKLNKITELGKRIFRGKKFHTTNANWDMKSEDGSKLSDNCVEEPITPSVAERVKNRRSCTLFNHEGQYANDGEGDGGKNDGKNQRCETPQSSHQSEQSLHPAVVVRRTPSSRSNLTKRDRSWCKLMSRMDWTQSEEDTNSPLQPTETENHCLDEDDLCRFNMNSDKHDTTGAFGNNIEHCASHSPQKKRTVTQKFHPVRHFSALGKMDSNEISQKLIEGDHREFKSPDKHDSISRNRENCLSPSPERKRIVKQRSHPIRDVNALCKTDSVETSQKLIEAEYREFKSLDRERLERVSGGKVLCKESKKLKKVLRLGRGSANGKIGSSSAEQETTSSPRLKLKIRRDLKNDCYSSTLEEIPEDNDSNSRTLEYNSSDFPNQLSNELSPLQHPSFRSDSDSVDLLETTVIMRMDSESSNKYGLVKNLKLSPVKPFPQRQREYNSTKTPNLKSKHKRKYSEAELETNNDEQTSTKTQSVKECLREELKDTVQFNEKSTKRRKIDRRLYFSQKNSDTNTKYENKNDAIVHSLKNALFVSEDISHNAINSVSDNFNQMNQTSHELKVTKNAQSLQKLHSKSDSKFGKRISKRKLSLSYEAATQVVGKKARLDPISQSHSKKDDSVEFIDKFFVGPPDQISELVCSPLKNVVDKKITKSESNKYVNSKGSKTQDPEITDQVESNDKFYSERSGNNISDLLNFVPSFSSPGKTNSSWDDACNSYLNTSLKISDQTPGKHDTLAGTSVMWSPMNNSPAKGQNVSKKFSQSKNDLGKKSGPNSHSLNIEALSVMNTNPHDYLTPTKRNNSARSFEASPSIQKVDSIVSFNHMSPQRLNFSPIKLNSPLRNLERSPAVQKVDCDISFNHMSPQRLTFSPIKSELQKEKVMHKK